MMRKALTGCGSESNWCCMGTVSDDSVYRQEVVEVLDIIGADDAAALAVSLSATHSYPACPDEPRVTMPAASATAAYSAHLAAPARTKMPLSC